MDEEAEMMMEEIASLSMGCPPRRSYCVSVGLDLFGVARCVVEFGSVGGGKRTLRESLHDDEAEALSRAKALLKAARRVATRRRRPIICRLCGQEIVDEPGGAISFLGPGEMYCDDQERVHYECGRKWVEEHYA